MLRSARCSQQAQWAALVWFGLEWYRTCSSPSGGRVKEPEESWLPASLASGGLVVPWVKLRDEVPLISLRACELRGEMGPSSASRVEFSILSVGRWQEDWLVECSEGTNSTCLIRFLRRNDRLTDRLSSLA